MSLRTPCTSPVLCPCVADTKEMHWHNHRCQAPWHMLHMALLQSLAVCICVSPHKCIIYASNATGQLRAVGRAESRMPLLEPCRPSLSGMYVIRQPSQSACLPSLQCFCPSLSHDARLPARLSCFNVCRAHHRPINRSRTIAVGWCCFVRWSVHHCSCVCVGTTTAGPRRYEKYLSPCVRPSATVGVIRYLE